MEDKEWDKKWIEAEAKGLDYKTRLRCWLGVEGPMTRAEYRDWNDRQLEKTLRRVNELETEVRQCMKFIGALFEHLEVRPQRTFVQDYSRLPSEEHPTMEVIKVTPAKPKRR